MNQQKPKSEQLITIVIPCYNEEENIEVLYERIEATFKDIEYQHDYLFIDNCSQDKTPEVLEKLAAKDPNVQVIFNVRNFGHIRSPYYGILQSQGDATIFIAADLQDPPEMMNQMIDEWEKGHDVVMGVKSSSKELWMMFLIRRIYYWFIDKLAEVPLVKNFYGFGLYDKQVIAVLQKYEDPYPYFRGQICELGFPSVQLEYVQEARARGITKNNFYTLLDIALLGITYHSKVPLRVGIIGGAFMSFISFLIGMGYAVAKVLNWDSFSMGVAPLLIGMFFFFSLQLVFLGVIGEYTANIYTQVLKRPLVVERKRLNAKTPKTD